MGDWNVLVAARLSDDGEVPLRDFRDVLYSLGTGQGTSTSVIEGALEARFGVQASDPAAAASEGYQLWNAAVEKLGLGVEGVDQLDVRSDAALRRDMDRRRLPQLAGLAEVAERLGVSRGRVGALRRGNRSFPKPIAHIKASPIWATAGVESFLQTWSRQPGRPSTREAAVDSAIEEPT